MAIPALSRSDLSVNDFGRSILKPRWIFGFAVVLVTLITLFTHTTSHSVSGLVSSISSTVRVTLTAAYFRLLTMQPETCILYILHVLEIVKQQRQGWSPLPHPGDE